VYWSWQQTATDPYNINLEDLNIQNEDENQNEDRSQIPYVGMRFSSLEEVCKFYNDYAFWIAK
jgi:hypothetical protein